MRLYLRRLLYAAAVWLLVCSSYAVAQEGPHSVELPNTMGIHTWFIIGIAGAFLVWAMSYSLQLRREAIARRKGHDDLAKKREGLLDKIAQLEEMKEAGKVTEQRYKHELRELKFHLGKVLDKAARPEPQKSLKKTS